MGSEMCIRDSFLTGRLGPYPFAGEKYAQVEVIWGGAMEHTTATSIGQFMYTGDRRFEQVVLHELAHQWFGDSLTPAGWQDIWLNEGFATYAEALWLEHSEGPAARDDFLQLIGPGRHPALFAGEGTLAEPSPVLPNTLVYDKGAWVLHMLRGIIGDEAFFAGCAKIPVSVNPRYGAWSKELCSLDGQSGSLSRPAQAPAG